MWTAPQWLPPVELSPAEEKIAARAAKKKKLFVFLRQGRGELFDPAFQEELLAMYRQTGAGKPPLPPALLAMATVLQAYTGVGDQETVELTADSKRWQLVLDCLGAEEPLFSQGALFDFRMRLLSTGMDRRLLERTVELARRRGGFEAKALRVALDSSPLWGHGRVEDTINLLGHAARQVLVCLAQLTHHEVAEVIERIGLSLFDAPSIKAALDIDWADAEQKQRALQALCDELDALQNWMSEHLPIESSQPPLATALHTLHTIMAQDLEPDPAGGGRTRLRKGVAKDRRISIADSEMRHGRKSAKTRFDGYKRHIARDLDEQLILAAAVLPANSPDTAGLEPLLTALKAQPRELTALHIDRGYLGAERIVTLAAQGVTIVCKPWPLPRVEGRFSKQDFELDLTVGRARCPAGQGIPITPGKTARFPAAVCTHCSLREQCTTGRRGRTLHIHPQEEFFQQLRVLPTTGNGRAALRERVKVEHGLAHVSHRQGTQARFNGTPKNTYHLRLVGAIHNLERAQALSASALSPQPPDRLAA